MFDHVEHDFNLPELICETLPTGRTYETPKGNKYPSITTVLGATSDKSGLEVWKNRVGEKEAAKILKQAGTRGTNVHQLAEDYLNNKPDWEKGHNVFDIFSFKQIKTILDENVNNIWSQEVPLYSDKFRIAGRVDCIAEYNGILSVIDFKTARKPKQREWIQGYFMQSAFYAAAFYERTGIPIKQTVIIITVDGHEPQVYVQDSFSYLKELAKRRKKYFEMRGF